MVKITNRFSVNPGNQSLRVLKLEEARAKARSIGCDFNPAQFERYGGKKLKLYGAYACGSTHNGERFALSFSADGDDRFAWREWMFKDYWDAGGPDATPAAKPVASKPKAAAPAKKNNKDKFLKMYLLMQMLGKKA